MRTDRIERAGVNAHRRALLSYGAGVPLLGAIGSLSACGGGGSDPIDTPSIQRFEASSTTPYIGDTTTLTAVFSGGVGRIEPDIGTVQSGAPIQTPRLDGARRYTLIVEAAGRAPARRELTVEVSYRNRYTAVAQPFIIRYHAAVAAADGSAIIIAGSRAGNTSSTSIDRYDPATGRFAKIGDLGNGRENHSATRLADGRILVVGGNTGLSGGPLAELIDLQTGVVSALEAPRYWRIYHAAVALPDGRALIVGGQGRDSVELWDPQTRRFSLVAARMQHPREAPSATLLADGRVLIAGGFHNALNNQSFEIFDPTTERFTPLDGGPAEQFGLHAAYRLSDGRVLIAGGETRRPLHEIIPLDQVLLFNPANLGISVQPGLQTARTVLSSVMLPDDRLLMFGGETITHLASDSAASYRVGNASSQQLANMPHGRAWHTVTRLGNGKLLIVGGQNEARDFVTTALLYD